MNNLLKYMVVILSVFTFTSCTAQTIKNKKTETVHISGNCGMCKNTIEKAGNLKKVAKVDWNKDTKIATITYDSLKTSKKAILKRIALVGYDNELYVSPNDTYQNLPGCCQYERAKKEVVSMGKHKTEIPKNHSTHHIITKETKKSKTKEIKRGYLKEIFDTYFDVKNALIQSDGSLTSEKSSDLIAAIEKVKMNELSRDVHMVWMKVMKQIKTDAKSIKSSNDESIQRTYFNSLSKNVYSLLKIAKYEVPVYYQFCPMANEGKGANWLSKENTVKNPYYGKAMLSCGKTVEILNK